MLRILFQTLSTATAGASPAAARFQTVTLSTVIGLNLDMANCALSYCRLSAMTSSTRTPELAQQQGFKVVVTPSVQRGGCVCSSTCSTVRQLLDPALDGGSRSDSGVRAETRRDLVDLLSIPLADAQKALALSLCAMLTTEARNLAVATIHSINRRFQEGEKSAKVIRFVFMTNCLV